ncbi:MAG: UDP-3-O-(3-hydroxymyristoyl)glucosamine N-acyltransferase [Pseudomonadota bacterium]
MELSITEVAKFLDVNITGDLDRSINGVSSFEEANASDITFACDSRFLNKILQTRAGAVIVPESFFKETEKYKTTTLLLSKQPKIDFFKIVRLFHPEKIYPSGIHSSANLGSKVQIGKNCVILSNVFIGNHVCIGDNVQLMPGVYIGDDVVIGDNVQIKPNVTIMEKTQIGNNVIVHSGTVIGSDGFGFAQASDRHEKLIHSGYVKILDNVEIGASNTIDRGTLGKTIIGNGVKTDNLVHIAHNVKIGDNTLIVAQVGIAGSTTIQNNVIIAGKAGISGHLTIGANAIVGPGAGIFTNVEENTIVSGFPQMEHTRWKKVVNIISRLPEMRKMLFSYEKRLTNIENKTQLTEKK